MILRTAPILSFLTTAIDFPAFVSLLQGQHIELFFRQGRLIRVVVLLMLYIFLIIRNVENNLDRRLGFVRKSR